MVEESSSRECQRDQNEASVDYALQEIKESFGRSDAARDALDAKAATLVGFGSAVLALVLQVAPQVLEPFEGPTIGAIAVGIGLVEAFVFAALVLLAIALWPRPYRGPRGADLASPELWREPVKNLKSRMIVTWEPLVGQADNIVKAKSRLFRYAVLCLLAGSFSLLIIGMAFLAGRVGR